MIRKLTAALIGVGVMVPGLANALGLGGIELDSALSEPLNARIELVQVRELQPEEILVNLAAAADFKNAGVERFHSLTDVKFDVVVSSEGKSHIVVKTRKPIREPFLNFLVEVNWPAGRLLREYTLLLDPPVFSATKEAPMLKIPSVPTPQPAPQVAKAPVTAAKPAPVINAPEPAASQAEPVAGGEGRTYGPTKSSDSLWGIARNLRPSPSVSIQQTMVAIQRLNPSAFINGNINLLRKGQVLRGPSENQVRELNSREAIAQVAQQNREWKDRVSKKSGRVAEAPQIDTSGRAVENVSSEPSDTGAHLKLVSASNAVDSESGQGGATDEGAGSAVLRGELQVAEEKVDQYRLATEDLKVRNSDLKEQLDTSDKVIGLKNEQIVALQSRLAEIEKEIQAAKDNAATAGAVEEAGSNEVVVEETVAGTSQEADALEADVEGAVVEEAGVAEEANQEPVDFNYEEAVQEEVAQEAEASEQAIVVEDTVQTPIEADVPVVKEQPKQEGFLDTLISNPIYMAAGGGLLLILIVGAMLAGRKKKEEDDVADSIADDFSLDGIGGADIDDVSDDFDALESDSFPEDNMETEEATVPQTADVIGEADIYIAYGRFPQAIEMLEKAAESEPDRPDIRAKLLEVAVEAEDVEVFKRHDAVLQTVGNHDHLAKAAELRSKLSIGNDAGEEAVIIPAEDTDFSTDSGDGFGSMDFDMDLTADEEPEIDIQEVSIPEADVSDALDAEDDVSSVDSSLDFDLDFSSEESVESVEGDDVSLDADVDEELDFSLDDETLELDASLDLDMDLAEEDLEFDADLDVDIEPISDFAEAEESLDVDLGVGAELDVDITESDLVEGEVIESDDGLEFDLDVDTELDLPESTPEASDNDDLEIDSSAAAQLADELDLDGDFDLDIDGGDDLSVDNSLDLNSGDDATVLMSPVVESVSKVAEAANEDKVDEMDFLTDADEISTKLDLARAYIDMGDRDGAKDILDEVMIEGTNDQQGDAKELIAKLG